MRIIGGKYRGKKLTLPTTDKIRPTSDMVKQAMFTKLQFAIDGKSFLDLFGGSGQMAIEALSRGAKVTIVDASSQSIRLVRQNLSGITEKAKLVLNDYQAALKSFSPKSFDYIFIDPPYDNVDCYEKSFELIFSGDLLTDDGLIICEHRSETELDCLLFQKIDTKKYGSKKLTYFAKTN